MRLHPPAVVRLLSAAILLASSLIHPSKLSAAAAPSLRLIRISGNRQPDATVATKLQHPFTVQVTDARGTPLHGIPIDWQVTSGGGSIGAASTPTNYAGLARNTLVLGTRYQSNIVTATIHGTGRKISFWTVALPGPAASITSYNGDHQVGQVASMLPLPLQVLCRDKYGNTARHTQVDWILRNGTSTLFSTSSISQTGIASRSFKLGRTTGPHTATATIHGTGTSYTFNVVATASTPTSLTITSGDRQISGRASRLPLPLTVTIKDSFGNLATGAQIDWSPIGGDSTISSQTTVSTSRGHALNTLILGSTPGSYGARATIHGTNISQTFSALAVDALVTMEPDPNANPRAFQPYFLGLSYEKIKINHPFFDATNLPLVALFRRLGPGVLRILAEEAPPLSVAWIPDGPGNTYNQLSQADLVRLAGFVKAVNWKVLYGIGLVNNHATCSFGETSCAANEAAAAKAAFGDNLLGFEIGNEPDVYSQPVYGSPPRPQLAGYSFSQFVSASQTMLNGQTLPSWPAFASAIQQAAPNARLTGPATGIAWARLFANSNQASRISLLTRHYYHLSLADSPTVTKLLAPDPRIATEFPELATMAAAAKIGGGYRISECNSVAAYVPGVTDAFGAALWMLDFLLQNAKYQSSGVNVHSGGDQVGTFSAILDDHYNVVGIGPDYYGMLAYSLVSKGGSLMSTYLTPAPLRFSAYSVQQPNGSTDVILINKDFDKSLTIAVNRRSQIKEATSLLMSAPSLTARKDFQLGGSPVTVNGNWSPTATSTWPIQSNSAIVTVPPGSVQIVHLH